ncbi:MAG TPA: hypothetical protein VFG31_07350 [Conexibacter sp.]|nr:hypothetical protein [Conexibacter sp.]
MLSAVGAASPLDALRDLGISTSVVISAIAAAVLLIGLLARLSENIHTLTVNLGRALRVMRAVPPFGRLSAEARRRLGKRQLYAEYVESRITRLNRLEQWADHRYAELEAEVETQTERTVGLALRRLPRVRRRTTTRSSAS